MSILCSPKCVAEIVDALLSFSDVLVVLNVTAEHSLHDFLVCIKCIHKAFVSRHHLIREIANYRKK